MEQLLRVAVQPEAYALPAVLSAVFMLLSKRGQGFMYYIEAHREHKFFSIEKKETTPSYLPDRFGTPVLFAHY